MSPTHSHSLGAYGEQVLEILGATPRNNVETVRGLLQGFASEVHADFGQWKGFPALSHVFQRLSELKDKAGQADFASWLTWNDRADALHAEAAHDALAARHRLRPRRTSSTHSDSASSAASVPPSPSSSSFTVPPPESGRSSSPVARERSQRPSILGREPRYEHPRPSYSMSYVLPRRQ
ncbi:hypothetical protein JCM10207_005830 [Rhodosporidiobolus poonsookiae]